MNKLPAPIPSMIKKSQLVYDCSSFMCIFLIVCDSMPVRRKAAKLMSDLVQRRCKNYQKYYRGEPGVHPLRKYS